MTLDDALNRNYYYYSGGAINTDFIKQVFFTFLGYDFNDFIKNRVENYRKNFGYTESHAKERALHQAVETCLRACDAMKKYRKEIKEFLAKHPELRKSGLLKRVENITDEVVDLLRYNELSQLRTDLGLKKSRKKKVTTVEPSSQETLSKAKESLREKTPAETVKTIIESNAEAEEKDREKEDSSYTLAELREIVGYDITYEEAIREGYHVDDAPGHERVEPTREEPKKPLPPARRPSKFELMSEINQELLEMPDEIVERCYWYLQDIKQNELGRKK